MESRAVRGGRGESITKTNKKAVGEAATGLKIGLKRTAQRDHFGSTRLSSLYSTDPDPSASTSSNTPSTSSRGASKPIARIARRNSFLSTRPEPSSSHFLNRSITRVHERDSASRSETRTYSLYAIVPDLSMS